MRKRSVLLVNGLNRWDLDMIAGSFRRFDSDLDGSISYEEFKSAIRALVAHNVVTDTHVWSVLKKIDLNQDSSISFAEYLEFVTGNKETTWLSKLYQNYSTFLTNKDVVILSDFKHHLGSILSDAGVSQARFDDMTRHLNRGRDGVVSFSEYVELCGLEDFRNINIVRRTQQQLAAPTTLNTESVAWQAVEERARCPKLFCYPIDDTNFCISNGPPQPGELKTVVMSRQNTIGNHMQQFVYELNLADAERIYPANVVVMQCGISDTIVYYYQLQSYEPEDIRPKFDFSVSGVNLVATLGSIHLIHTHNKVIRAIHEFVGQVLSKSSLPIDDLASADYLVVLSQYSLTRLVPALKNREIFASVGEALYVAWNEHVHFKHLRASRFLLLSNEAEVQAGLLAARFFKPNVTSILSIGALKMDGLTADMQQMVDIPVGSGTARRLSKPWTLLWEKQVFPALRDFRFGPRPLFLAGFIFGLRTVCDWLKSQETPSNRYKVTRQTLEQAFVDDGLAHEQFVVAMTSTPVQTFFDKTVDQQQHQRAWGAMIFFQQILVCGRFSPNTMILLENRFARSPDDPVKTKITVSFGWLMQNPIETGD
eukprot:c9155_g1_i1.p1 GENE.c9155_g1_i1~~c9155_g1_i1.p1  ORF type:complete len:595 (-),score=102.61 c9155_g1_i1:73-1857(-)